MRSAYRYFCVQHRVAGRAARSQATFTPGQPWSIAKQKGAFAAAGIELEYTDYPGGTGAMTKALNENALDVAILLTEGCVKDIATGGTHKIVAVNECSCFLTQCSCFFAANEQAQSRWRAADPLIRSLLHTQVYVQSSLCWGIHTGAAQEDIQSVSDLDGKVFSNLATSERA